MKNNAELQKDVQDAIKWEPLLNAAEIGVTVKDGIVTLTGTVKSWYQRDEAEKIVWNAPGVWSVDNELVVEYYYDLVH